MPALKMHLTFNALARFALMPAHLVIRPVDEPGESNLIVV